MGVTNVPIVSSCPLRHLTFFAHSSDPCVRYGEIRCHCCTFGTFCLASFRMRSDPVGFAPNTYFQRASSCRKRSNTAIDQKSTGLRPCLTRLRFRLKSLRCSLVLTDIPVRMLRSLGRSHACRIMLRNLSTAVLRLADCVRCSDTCMTRYCSLLTR